MFVDFFAVLLRAYTHLSEIPPHVFAEMRIRGEVITRASETISGTSTRYN